MVRNPFLKEDKGISFICFITSAILIQVIFFFIIINVIFMVDHSKILIKIAKQRGLNIDMQSYNLDQSKHNYTLSLGDPDYPLLQREGIILVDTALWIPIILFYIFSILWFIAYFKLLFVDISCPPSVIPPEDALIKQSKTLYCQKCQVSRRSDIYHCPYCGVCNELHDHHCDVLQICICAKNYKYFILFMAYASLQCISVIFSLIRLNVNITNTEITRYYGMRNMMGIIGFGFFALIFAAITIIMLSDAPCSEGHEGGSISRQLKAINKNKKFTKGMFCKQYFKSSYNFIRWILPY